MASINNEPRAEFLRISDSCGASGCSSSAIPWHKRMPNKEGVVNVAANSRGRAKAGRLADRCRPAKELSSLWLACRAHRSRLAPPEHLLLVRRRQFNNSQAEQRIP